MLQTRRRAFGDAALFLAAETRPLRKGRLTDGNKNRPDRHHRGGHAGGGDRLNAILHEFAGCIVGRMGIPYHAKDVSIISVVVDAPNNVISSLSGKLGMLPGVSIKTVYSKAGGPPHDAE